MTSNMQTAVIRALTAYKVENGVAAQAAAAWATANLPAAITCFESALSKYKTRPDDEDGVRAAFQSLKTWAQAQS